MILSGIKSNANEAPKLTSRAEISLLTCTPGAELYSLFGHSAMRVKDPELDIDLVFNYGTFSFDDDFYFNFTMGRLNYKLSVSMMDGFVRSYQYEGRGISEQVLNLDSAQRQAVMNFLFWNALPENRFYLYDFFYDNCSSRLRDVLENSLPNEDLNFSNLQDTAKPSFRDLIDQYLVYHPWGDFGIDLGLGMPCDMVPSSREYMFLPDYLDEAFDHATINGNPLVSEEKTLLETDGLTYAWSVTNPIPLFWLIFGLFAVISAIGLRMHKRFVFLDVIYLIATGAVGALVFFLGFITDHTATANNLNILWAWPIHLPAIGLLFWKKGRLVFWIAYAVVLVVTLIAFPILPQSLHLATIPIMLIGLLRSAVNIKMG